MPCIVTPDLLDPLSLLIRPGPAGNWSSFRLFAELRTGQAPADLVGKSQCHVRYMVRAWEDDEIPGSQPFHEAYQ